MKPLLTIALVLITIQTSLAQKDSTKVPNGEYSQYIYNENTNSINHSYNYSNKWDLDGDKKKDSLFFIGNGGAHTYFFLRIILSSDSVVRNFPSVQIDMPYFVSFDTLKKWGKNPGVQFVVSDFDNDGSQDIYLNLDNRFGSIPKN